MFIPLWAKRVGEFIEIRHKKISLTPILGTLGCLSLCNSVANKAATRFTNGPYHHSIKNLSKLAPFPGGPWNLPHKFHLNLIQTEWICRFFSIRDVKFVALQVLFNLRCEICGKSGHEAHTRRHCPYSRGKFLHALVAGCQRQGMATHPFPSPHNGKNGITVCNSKQPPVYCSFWALS